ncbi:hypothetical protein N510_003189 [Firmicutes bacterium ASF500]|nr:hypothetical protein N510_003189 [Firmicutes bacterium ASF500]
MKKLLALTLAAALALSLAACGGGGDTSRVGNRDTSSSSVASSTPKQENSPIESKGLFLLEREDGVELDDLTAQQTYLIHVYDINTDSAKNVEMSPFESSYAMTMNGVNEYKALSAPVSYAVDKTYNTPSTIDYFMLASGYAAPPELETILAGGEKIRAMSVYKINLNDIKDDTTATFKVEYCDVYDCELNFTRNDIISISRFDDVFQVEDNPTDYQIAATYFKRVEAVCSNMITGTMFDRLHSNGLISYEDGLYMIEVYTTYTIFDVTGVVGLTEEFFEKDGAPHTDLPRFDREAVKRIYPDMPVDAFEDGLEIWLTNGKIAVESLKNDKKAGTEGQLADAALNDMATYGRKILEYYTAKLTNK